MLRKVQILHWITYPSSPSAVHDKPYSDNAIKSLFGHLLFTFVGGNSRSHAHLSLSFGSNSPHNISTTYFPRTGRNLNPWKEPQVATYNPSQAE
jgi:hypothetical protein